MIFFLSKERKSIQNITEILKVILRYHLDYLFEKDIKKNMFMKFFYSKLIADSQKLEAKLI